MKNPQRIAKTHEIIKTIRTFKKNYRPQNHFFVEDLSILEGINPDSVNILVFLYVADRMYSQQAQVVIDRLTYYAKESYIISDKTAEMLAEKNNVVGLFAFVEPIQTTINAFKDANFLVVLDQMENPGNLGTIIRTCDAVSVDGILHVDSAVHINHTTAIASSRGMVFEVPSVPTNFLEASHWLLENGFEIYIGEPVLGKSIEHVDYGKKIAIVVGSERFGVNLKWFEIPHHEINIPMFGKMKSLNVAVATAIVLYDVAMKKRKGQTT